MQLMRPIRAPGVLRLDTRLALRPAEAAQALGISVRTLRQILPELLTLPTAAREAGIGVRQLRRAAAQGKVPVFLIGGWSRVRWPDVLRWIERQRVPVTPHAEKRVAEVLAREARGERGNAGNHLNVALDRGER